MTAAVLHSNSMELSLPRFCPQLEIPVRNFRTAVALRQLEKPRKGT